MVGNKELLCGSGKPPGEIEKPYLVSNSYTGQGTRFPTCNVVGSKFAVKDGEDTIKSIDIEWYDDAAGTKLYKSYSKEFISDSSYHITSSSYCEPKTKYLRFRYIGNLLGPSEWSNLVSSYCE